MPHFMARKRIVGPRHFNAIPQTGKRFFYHIDLQGFPVDDNTVINYECTLALSHSEFQQLIQNITGNPNPTAATSKYNYHLDKQVNRIDLNYCTNTLGLPMVINGYTLSTIGIAANYTNQNADGNILFLFRENINPNNEVCISIHINHSRANTPYLNNLRTHLQNAVTELNSPNNRALWQLKPRDDFNSLGYVVTGIGVPIETDYKQANNYERQIGNQIANLFN